MQPTLSPRRIQYKNRDPAFILSGMPSGSLRASATRAGGHSLHAQNRDDGGDPQVSCQLEIISRDAGPLR